MPSQFDRRAGAPPRAWTWPRATPSDWEDRSAMLEGTLNWDQPSRMIVADVSSSRSDGSPLVSYLTGAKISLLSAEVADGTEVDLKGSAPSAGTIVALEPDGPFLVQADDGKLVRVTDYLAEAYVHQTTALRVLFREFGLTLPQRLGQRPFLQNRDSA